MKILRCFILTLCLLISLQSASAAIAFSTAADLGNNGGSTNSLTTSFTVSAGVTYMHVCLQGDSGGGADDISSVTWNGTSMTLVQKQTGASTRMSYDYGLVSPASGTHNVVVTAGSSHFLLAGTATYTGTSTSGQPEASNTGQSTSTTSYTTSLTTTTDNAWVTLCAGANLVTAGTNCTSRSVDATFASWRICDSGGVVHPAGSFSMTTTNGSATVGNHIMASIAPAAGVATVVKRHSGGVF